MNYNNNPRLTDRIGETGCQESLGASFEASFEFEEAAGRTQFESGVKRKQKEQEEEVEMEPGQVELSSLLGWLRTFSLQSQVGGWH